MISVFLVIQAIDPSCVELPMIDPPSKSITKAVIEEGLDQKYFETLSKIYDRDYPMVPMCHPYDSIMDTVPFVAYLDFAKTILPENLQKILSKLWPKGPIELFVLIQSFEEKRETLFRPQYWSHRPKSAYIANYNIETESTTTIYYPETNQEKQLLGRIYTHSGENNLLVLSPNNLSLGVIPVNGAEFFSLTHDGKVAALTYHILLPISEANKVADIASKSANNLDFFSRFFMEPWKVNFPFAKTYDRLVSLFYREELKPKNLHVSMESKIPEECKELVNSFDMETFIKLNADLIKDAPSNLNPDDLGKWWKWRAYFNLEHHEGLPFMEGMKVGSNWRKFLETPEGQKLNEKEELISIFGQEESPEKEFNMGLWVQNYMLGENLKSEQK